MNLSMVKLLIRKASWLEKIVACLVYAICSALILVSLSRSGKSSGNHSFTLEGLYEPAVVSDSIFISAPQIPAGAIVTYALDGKVIFQCRNAPYWLGDVQEGVPAGYSVTPWKPGPHTLTASARDKNGEEWAAGPLSFTVAASQNLQFSPQLNPYPNQLRHSRLLLPEVLRRTTTPSATLPSPEIAVREAVLRMYLNSGIDPSFDKENFRSDRLLQLTPQRWAPASLPQYVRSTADLSFSADAPFYHPIPADGPRVALPDGYIKNTQLNTTVKGDGIGYGIVLGKPGDPLHQIVSEWPGNPKTRVVYQFPMPDNWFTQIPWQEKGDRHVIFVDVQSNCFVSAYKVSKAADGAVHADYASAPTSLNSLGDRGGSTSSGFAELPLLIRPGEATNQDVPIQHALGGPVHRTWLARVFPASGWDYGLETAVDSCTGHGFANNGLVPFGGVIQLDPQLDLKRLHLSLPAFRILEAIQKYGFYVMDYGCADLDIYTSVSEDEFDPFGGLWGYNRRGEGVQKEVERVLQSSTLYVVLPLVKRM